MSLKVLDEPCWVLGSCCGRGRMERGDAFAEGHRCADRRDPHRAGAVSDYRAVQETLSGGGDPAMLCATCPWDRNCITPPTMTSAEIDARVRSLRRKTRPAC